MLWHTNQPVSGGPGSAPTCSDAGSKPAPQEQGWFHPDANVQLSSPPAQQKASVCGG